MGTITIDNKEVNVLFGNKPKNGSGDTYEMNFDGKNDTLFKEGLQLIKENLESESYSNEKGFFKLQMNYMLLWSAIDRYSKLKYNKEKESDNRKELSKVDLFKEALLKYADKNHRLVFNTENLYLINLI